MAKTNIRPLGDNVLVAPEKAEKKTEAGIYLPEGVSKEQPQQGAVVAVGDGEKIRVKKGDVVIYKRYGGTDVKEGDAEYLLIEAEDILAVVEK